MQLLEHKVALVTGVSGGIGRGIVRRLAAEAATLVVTVRRLKRAGNFAGILAETVSLISFRPQASRVCRS